jgi:hypothetical protein
MQMKLIWFLVQTAPVAASIIGMMTFSVYAAEVSSPTESSRLATASISTEPTLIETPTSPVTGTTVVDSVIQSSLTSSTLIEFGKKVPGSTNIFQTWTGNQDNIQWKVSNIAVPTTAGSIEAKSGIVNGLSNRTLSSDPILSVSDSEQVTSNRAQDLGEAQTVHLLASDTTEETEPPSKSDASEAVPSRETSSSPRWQFTFTPYAFVPLSVDGSATVRDFTADINLGLNDILNPLNFAAAGRLEAWRGNLGFIFDGAYFNLGQESSKDLSIPNCLCGIFPSKINTDINVQFGQFDLGVGYRVAANPLHAATEFDLGPLVFDIIAGMRIYALQQQIDISTNLGTERNLEQSNTLVQPLLSGRLRWNLSPTLAGWVRGDIAGFGLGGTLMAASFTGGLDWMFSGNTSLLLAYRLSSLQLTTDVAGEAFKLNLLLQGPYMGIVFRF